MGRRAVIVLDTHVMIYDALAPARVSSRARKAIDSGYEDENLACADISLWEVAMLIARGRVDPLMDPREFMDTMIAARRVRVLPITIDIAVLAQSDLFAHGDPADRLIAATAQLHGATLVTSDTKLRALSHLDTIW